MTSLIQAFNDAETIARAKNIWWSVVKTPAFKFISSAVLKNQEKLCRALCAEEDDIKKVAFRCWKQFGFTPKKSEARVIIEDHLERYGEIRDIIADEMISNCLEFLLEEKPIEDKRRTIQRLLVALEVLGSGFSRRETDLYRTWWSEFTHGRGHTEPGYQPGQFLWHGIKLEEESLSRWIINKLRSEPERKVPYLIKAIRVEIDLSQRTLKQIMQEYLNLVDTPEEYVQRWWRLADSKSISFQMLIDELRHSMWDPQTLRRPLFRSAGRFRPKKLKAAAEMMKTGELGEAFATLIALGFEFTTDVREILEERLTEEQDPAECFRALKAIGEFRIVAISAFREWKTMLIQRLGEEVAKTCKIGLRIDQEIYKPPQVERRDKHEALLLMRAITDCDPNWHSKIDSWLFQVQDSYRKGFQNIYEQWLQIRKNMLRDGPCRKGTIDTLFYEPCGNRWRTSKLKCTEPLS
jgi:hypothetical protein